MGRLTRLYVLLSWSKHTGVLVVQQYLHVRRRHRAAHQLPANTIMLLGQHRTAGTEHQHDYQLQLAIHFMVLETYQRHENANRFNRKMVYIQGVKFMLSYIDFTRRSSSG